MLPSDGSLPGLSSFIPYGGPPTSAFQIVDADPGGVDELIRTRGTTVDVWQSVVCPCSRTESGRARRDCPLCLGAMYVYPPNLRCTGIRILLVGHQQSLRDMPDGREVGSVNATFPSQAVPRKGWLVFPRGMTHEIDEVVIRGKNPLADAVASRRRSDLVVQPVDDAPDDSLRYPRVESVKGVWGWNRDAALEVLAGFHRTSLAGIPEGQLAAVYAAGLPEYRGWELVDGNLMRWTPGTGPELGTAYTVKYEAPAVYEIAEDPGYRTDGDTRLQRKPAKLIRYDAIGHDERLRGVY